MIPGLDGWQVLHELRCGPASEVPVVICSAVIDSDHARIQAEHFEVAGMVTKPYRLEDLRVRWRRSCRQGADATATAGGVRLPPSHSPCRPQP